MQINVVCKVYENVFRKAALHSPQRLTQQCQYSVVASDFIYVKADM
jgi:hypothetical protein